MGVLRMASVLEEVERDLLRRAKEEGAAFADKQNARLGEELMVLKEASDAKKAAVATDQRRDALAQMEKAVAAASQSAMKAALAQVQIRERLANLGHKGGGLLQSARDGVTAAQNRRHEETKAAKEAALADINRAAATLYQELEAAYTQKAEALARETAQKITDKQASLDAAAKKQAKQIARSAKSYAQWQEGLY